MGLRSGTSSDLPSLACAADGGTDFTLSRIVADA